MVGPFGFIEKLSNHIVHHSRITQSSLLHTKKVMSQTLKTIDQSASLTTNYLTKYSQSD